MCFRNERATLPLAAFAEDYIITPTSDSTCELHWHHAFEWGGRAKPVLGRLFGLAFAIGGKRDLNKLVSILEPAAHGVARSRLTSLTEMPTTLLDVDQLEVYLSPKDACYGLRQWDIIGHATVATARRSGWRPSGIRHRLPIDLRTNDGTVVCRVKRSRALKAMAKRYQILDVDGDVMGTVERKQMKLSEVHQRLLAADGTPLGELRRVDSDASSSRDYRYVEPEDGVLRDVQHRRTATKLKVKGTWRVSGLSSVPEEVRLLVVAHLLIIEPWAAGENAADKTTNDH